VHSILLIVMIMLMILVMLVQVHFQPFFVQMGEELGRGQDGRAEAVRGERGQLERILAMEPHGECQQCRLVVVVVVAVVWTELLRRRGYEKERTSGNGPNGIPSSFHGFGGFVQQSTAATIDTIAAAVTFVDAAKGTQVVLTGVLRRRTRHERFVVAKETACTNDLAEDLERIGGGQRQCRPCR
jgi:uncharacterized protein YdeI (BOF family)